MIEFFNDPTVLQYIRDTLPQVGYSSTFQFLGVENP